MARFLYAEDDDSVRQWAVTFFEDFFPEDSFVAVVSYREVVAAISEQGPFDFMISDFHYSGAADNGAVSKFGSGGLDSLKYLKENGIKLPFAFLSGTDLSTIQEQLAARRLELSADHIFYKTAAPIFEVVEWMKARYCPENRPEKPKAEGANAKLVHK